jgi:hypothetical protein
MSGGGGNGGGRGGTAATAAAAENFLSAMPNSSAVARPVRPPTATPATVTPNRQRRKVQRSRTIHGDEVGGSGRELGGVGATKEAGAGGWARISSSVSMNALSSSFRVN